jgi:predicted nucleic acid-binding protein
VTEAYLDACCILYMTEGAPAWRAAIEARLRTLPQSGALVTSRISRLECRSKPIRDRDTALLARFDATFANARIVEVTEAIIERATELRAR